LGSLIQTAKPCFDLGCDFIEIYKYCYLFAICLFINKKINQDDINTAREALLQVADRLRVIFKDKVFSQEVGIDIHLFRTVLAYALFYK
jgi:hypothetical protein